MIKRRKKNIKIHDDVDVIIERYYSLFKQTIGTASEEQIQKINTRHMRQMDSESSFQEYCEHKSQTRLKKHRQRQRVKHLIS